MNDKSLDYFKKNINLIRYEYNKADQFDKRTMKHELYSNRMLNLFEKDTIWTYINESTDSPYFMDYKDFIGRCKFYEDNARLYSANDK